MKLNESGGDMYEDTYTTNPLGGRCKHQCLYCYVEDLRRFPHLNEKYSGEIRLIPKVLTGNTGTGKTIFVCSCNDMFQKDAKEEDIIAILEECNRYPDNTYIFQSKNPMKMLAYMNRFPPNSIFITTIETNRQALIEEQSKAPSVIDRAQALRVLSDKFLAFAHQEGKNWQISITIEPIMDYDVEVLANIVRALRPDYVSIGADSKDSGLTEPTAEKVRQLIGAIEGYTRVVQKPNLKRLIEG